MRQVCKLIGVPLHPVCQEELYDPGRDMSINPRNFGLAPLEWKDMRGLSNPSSGRTGSTFLFLTVLAGGLYLPLLSSQYDLNGIIEGIEIEQGTEYGSLYSPNHLLYRLIGFAVWRSAQLIGYGGPSIDVLQIVSAVFGAFAVGCTYLFLNALLVSRPVAVLVTLGFATSLSQWMFSIDAAYMGLAAAFAAGSLMLFIRSSSPYGFALTGVAAGLAVLAWQANIFLLVGLGIGLVVRSRAASFPRSSWLWMIGGWSLVVGIGYALPGILSLGHNDLVSLFYWITNHGGPSGSLPMWGGFDISRLWIAFNTLPKSLIGPPPVSVSGSLFFDVPSWLPRLSLVCLSAILLWSVVSNRVRSNLIWVAFAYIAFIPFIAWWDPWEPKWWIVPNVILAGVVALSLDAVPYRRFCTGLAGVCIATVAFSNFSSFIWPAHAHPDPKLELANCVGTTMGDGDLFLATDWNWDGLLIYFHHQQVFSVLGEATIQGRGDALRRAMLARVRRELDAGHSVYMLDPEAYYKEHLDWLESQTGLKSEDLIGLPRKPAFECGGRTIYEIDPAGFYRERRSQ